MSTCGFYPTIAVLALLSCSLVKSAMPSDSHFTHTRRIYVKAELSILLPVFLASQMYFFNTQNMSMTSSFMFLVPQWASQCYSERMAFLPPSPMVYQWSHFICTNYIWKTKGCKHQIFSSLVMPSLWKNGSIAWTSTSLTACLRKTYFCVLLQINDTTLLFNSPGVFFVVLDACSGAVVSRRHFDTVAGENVTDSITDYVQTLIKER